VEAATRTRPKSSNEQLRQSRPPPTAFASGPVKPRNSDEQPNGRSFWSRHSTPPRPSHQII